MHLTQSQFYKKCDVCLCQVNVYFLQYQKEKTKDSNKIKRDFLDVLLSACDENGAGLTDKEIQEETDTFLFAGLKVTRYVTDTFF